MAYPVSYDVQRPERYNRLTVAFRLILVLPHVFLVGGSPFFSSGSSSTQNDSGWEFSASVLSVGVLTYVAAFLVFLAWWAILFSGRYPASFRDFVTMIFRWAMNVHAYLALQTDPYPPFSGNAPYPLRVHVPPDPKHNRLSVAFRIFLVIPHVVALVFLQIALVVMTVIAWFAILFTGQYPEAMYPFSVGVSRWYARVYAYMSLLVDEYPPFSLFDGAGAEAAQPYPA